MDASSPKANARMWVAGLLLLLLSQALFWSVVGITERAARPANMAMREDVHYVLYDKNGQPLSGGWELKAERDRFRGYFANGSQKADHAVFSLLFSVADKSQPLSFFLENREDIDGISLNGVPIQPDKPLRRLQGNISVETALYPLPANYLQNGTNVLYIRTNTLLPQISLSPFAIGPARDLESAYRLRGLLQVDIPVAGVAILLFTVALCMVVNWPHEDRPRMRWLIAFLTINAASTLFFTLVPQAGSLLWFQLPILVLCNLALGLSAGRYAVLDGGSRHRWPIFAVGGFVAAIIAAIIILLIFWPEFSLAPFRIALFLSNVAVLFIAIFAILAIILHSAKSVLERWGERLVFILCLTTLAVDRFPLFFEPFAPFNPDWPISLYWSPLVGPLLGIGMVLSLARQAGEARREVTRSNEILAARLAEQDAELSRSYDAQKQMLQRQVMLEERQRIVRDMHDGIGGQLLGLMMQVRQGGADSIEIEQGLQSSIADLRLIVDSMDSAEEGLAETFRSFEHRVRTQVEASGIELEFYHDIEESIDLGPRPTLQVLRILQEAVTNAMRHSAATKITVQGSAHDAGTIQISVSDNGTGLPSALRRGRGLTSMETRARNLGGELSIESCGTGTKLCLAFGQSVGEITQ
jgi:two-component system, NarL family, sensor histidine kinase UhpB